MPSKRIEHDALGELAVPLYVYWGINTQRALQNFKISGRTFPEVFIRALARVKLACLLVNKENEDIDSEIASAIERALKELLEEDKFLDQFPVDVFQTGSGTQINMNMNEVIANRANEILGHEKGKKYPVHPNDHVNKGQSSNDVIPTAMHLAALEAISDQLLPAVDHMIHVIDDKVKEFEGVIKVGRTHLQDAVPIPLSLEFAAYRQQLLDVYAQLQTMREDLVVLPIGGTALGTGINTRPDFGEDVIERLSKITGFPLKPNPVKAAGIASHAAIVKTSGALRMLALVCLKIANDIRWMASGPRAGLGELNLPANEPGSSIMPGKVNPTQSEMMIQVAIQVIGHDATIAAAEAHGSVLDLNVTKPLMIINLLDAIHLLTNGITSFADNCLRGITPNLERISEQLDRSLMLVTRLVPFIGYDKAAEIALTALQKGKTIREVITEMGLEINADLDEVLDPRGMV